MKHLAFLFALALAAHAEETESPLRLIRTTEAQTPAQEEKALHVPEGFEVHLFASEPMIHKPVNMAFDERGRLWISSTKEYPYSADKSRWADAQGSHIKDSTDAIKILEDTDGDGVADKVTVFADGLNIPTGVLPWHRPEDKAGCIAWSIPNIWYFADTTGKGVCDKREVLFGPLGYEKDTHGMCSSFRLGLDGWVYATHGFNNTSHIKVLPQHFKPAHPGEKPDTLDLHSGNVFRFRPDGSHVEIWSWGQVNPFGLCWDKYENLYSADCHSNPLTQLIKGAYYPSFGKPNDGLGYGPVMCTHSHGSTGLCGVLYIDGGVWGPEWDDHMILGNCVTSKVNHDHITFEGSTPTANEGPDFITSDDPWFRPVDLQLGPDSALYVADFYNRIIGHYEIPLDHPGRDRTSGRIWRVSRKGYTKRLASLDIDAETDDAGGVSHAVAQALGYAESPNLTTRHLAHQQMMTIHGPKPLLLVEPWHPMAGQLDYLDWSHEAARQRKSNRPMPGLPWEKLEAEGPVNGPLFLIHQLRQVVEYGFLEGCGEKEVCAGLSHKSPLVQRWCASALQTWPGKGSQAALIEALKVSAKTKDLALHYTLQRALLENLKLPGAFSSIPADRFGEIFEIAKAVPTAEASAALLAHWQRHQQESGGPELLGLIARHADDATLDHAIAGGRDAYTSDADAVRTLDGIYNRLLERGSKPSASLTAWAAALADRLLSAPALKKDPAWQNIPYASQPASENPWCVQERKCADSKAIKVLSSLNKDLKSPEKLTGVVRSRSFMAPEKLSFWICGHRGLPKEPANKLNLARLVDARTGEVLKQAFPPRSDICQRVEWDLAALPNRQMRFEIVDGDAGKSYAWLGVGRIEPAVLDVDHFESEGTTRKQLRQLAEMLKMSAPVALRDRLRPYLPVSVAAPAAVSPEDRKRLDTLIASRAKAFAKANPSADKGAQVFTANCAVCHQIKNQGGLIGPQLDGIGNRGVDRLMEDVLDPNRNVDAHFQLHVITLLDGSEVNGFVRGEAGQVLIIVDPAGQERRVSKNEIKDDKTTAMSLMPPVFGQTIPESDFMDLIRYLMTRS